METYSVKFLAEKVFPHSDVARGDDYKGAWVQAVFDELRGTGRLTWMEIALATDLSKQYIYQVKNGNPPSDLLIEGLCWVFKFDPPSPEGAKPVLDAVKAESLGTPSSSQAATDLRVERLTRAIEQQGDLIRTLTELIIAKLGPLPPKD